MRILHFWSKGPHVGDFFYAQAQQKLLRECLGAVDIWEDSCARHNPGDEGITKEKLMQPADAVIVGGGPLYDLRGEQGNLFVSADDLIDCGKPVFVWSAGLEANLDHEGRWMTWEAPSLPNIRSLHSVATSAAVRDRATQNWLHRLGYPSEVTGDASHFLTPLESVHQRSGPVLFAWRHDLCEPIVRVVSEWLSWAAKQRLEVRLICLSDADAQSAARLGFPYFHAGQEVKPYIELLGSAGAVLGCRMHAAIVALIQGVPSHCFYATSRIKTWGEDFFGDGWVLPVSDMTTARLCKLTDELLSGDMARFEPFTERVGQLRSETERWLERNFEGGGSMREYRRLPQIKQPTHHEESYDDPRQQRRVSWVVANSVGTVLELGCAEGYILSQIGRPGCVGVDYDQERVREGKGKYPDIKLYVLDIRYGLPFGDGSFDTVLAAEILEHMEFEDAKYVLAEAERVAKHQVLITLPFEGGPGCDKHLVYGVDHRWAPSRASVDELLAGRDHNESLFDGFIYIEVEK